MSKPSLSGLNQAQARPKDYPGGFTGLTRTPSEHAQLSLARMASLETYHVHDSHEDELNDSHGLADIRSNLSEPRDLERRQSIHRAPELGVTESVIPSTAALQSFRPESIVSKDGADNSHSAVSKSKDDVYDDRKEQVGLAGDLDLQTGESQDSNIPSPDASRQLQDQTNLLPVRQVVFVFLGLSCALFVSLLDQTIVSTALPTLGRVFSRAEIASWVATAYLLTSTAVQPIYSRLSDVFGRKIMLVISLLIFSAGSLACALSQSMIQLIVFRAIAGLGGGGIVTLVMIVVSDVVSLKERGKYQGILGGVVATANSVGPVLGGVFTEKASWRWCFWINLPMTALALMVVFFALPLKPVKGDIWAKFRRIDYYGCLLTLAFSVLILMALSWGGTQYAWDSAGVLAPLIIGMALLGVFIFVEWKIVPLPLIPMHIFRDATVSGAMIATFLSGMVFYAQLFFLPQYFQVVRGDSAIRSGILLLPLIVVQTVTSFTAGVIVSKTGDYRVNLYLGFAIWTIGTGLLTTIGPTTSTAKLCGYQVLSGIGGGQTFQTSLVAIQATVARQEMAVAIGARNFIRMLGGSVALAACASLLNNAVSNELYKDAAFPNDLVRQIVSDPTQINDLFLTAGQKDIALRGYTRGIRNVFYLLLPCCAICFFVVVIFVKAHSLKRDDDATLKKEGKDWVAKRKERCRQGAGPEMQTSKADVKTTGTLADQRR